MARARAHIAVVFPAKAFVIAMIRFGALTASHAAKRRSYS